MEQRNRRLECCWFLTTPMPRLAPVTRAIGLFMFIRASCGFVPNGYMMRVILKGEGERPMAGRTHMSVACYARSVVLLDQRFARGREHCTPFGVAPQRAREL